MLVLGRKGKGKEQVGPRVFSVQTSKHTDSNWINNTNMKMLNIPIRFSKILILKNVFRQKKTYENKLVWLVLFIQGSRMLAF
jgi:hypothetical protein